MRVLLYILLTLAALLICCDVYGFYNSLPLPPRLEERPSYGCIVYPTSAKSNPAVWWKIKVYADYPGGARWESVLDYMFAYENHKKGGKLCYDWNEQVFKAIHTKGKK